MTKGSNEPDAGNSRPAGQLTVLWNSNTFIADHVWARRLRLIWDVGRFRGAWSWTKIVIIHILREALLGQ